MKIGIVLGTRPEVIKNYSIVKALRAHGAELSVIHTNQHSIESMNDAIFRAMGFRPDATMPAPYEVGKAIDWTRAQIRAGGLEMIIVNGDTGAAMVGALAAMYEDVEVAHVEAGLRSFDNQMYEERHRMIVDAVAHHLFTYTSYEQRYLEALPDLRGRIYCVGNTTLDVIHDFASRIRPPEEQNYAYVTLHRKELTDSAELMSRVFAALRSTAAEFERVIFPVHPRTLDAMRRHGMGSEALAGLDLRAPLSPFESLSYEKHARVIITDSGCVQEEAYIFNVPCVTLRNNTERHLTVEKGANVVTGFDDQKMRDSILAQAKAPRRVYDDIYGGPGAGERIACLVLGVKDGAFEVPNGQTP